MITVDQALAHLFDLVKPTAIEEVPLRDAAGRVLATAQVSRRDQPPFPASAMDGYAVPGGEVRVGAKFTVIGESAAGARFEGTVGAGQAVRIFTGAPVPVGATHVVIQEDVARDGDQITLTDTLESGSNIRPAGNDFKAGQMFEAPKRLTPQDVALLASMNIPCVPVYTRPTVALISTGDELVMPGQDPGPDQIIASNTFGIDAQLRAIGALPRILPIARDTRDSLATVFDLAKGNDLIVTIGGASVGDHDLVGPVAADLGMDRSFYKIAMRPGKPLMAGRMGDAAMVGLPGNPVSAMVCAQLFLAPMIHAMQGLPAGRTAEITLPLSAPLPANGNREHYMRARVENGSVAAFDRQDSSLLSILSNANALIVRPVGDGPRETGEMVRVIAL